MEPAPPRVVIDVPVRTIVRVILLVLVAIAAVEVLSAVSRILVWLATALFLAVVLQPAVRLAERRLSHTLAVFAVFAGLALVVVGFLALLIIPLASQVDHLRTAAPAYIDDLRHNATINDLNTRYHLVARAQDAAKALPTRAFGALGKLVSGVIATITVLFLTLFLLLELPTLIDSVLAFVPADKAERVRRVGSDINRSVAGYVLGNLIISVIAAIVVGVSLRILDVPYALALALLMGLADLVPLVGATVGALAAIGVALATQGVGAGDRDDRGERRLPAGRKPRAAADRVPAHGASLAVPDPGRRAHRRRAARRPGRPDRNPDRRLAPAPGPRTDHPHPNRGQSPECCRGSFVTLL